MKAVEPNADWLVRAEFIASPPLSVLWLIVALLWFFAILGTKRHYEHQQ